MSSLDCEDNLNLFQPTSFRVVMNRKHYGAFQFFVSKVNHPGAQNPAAETPFSRLGGVPMPGNSMTYGELSMDVLLDEDFRSYIEIYDWMLRLVNEDQIAEAIGYSNARHPIPTYADIHITALSNHNNKNVTFKYIGCVPTSLGDIPFDAQNQSVEFVTFPATFRFSYFTMENDLTREGR